MDATIKKITAREILDSRGEPTLEVTVFAGDAARGTFSVPAGASKGSHEAAEKRDGDAAAFRGMGVSLAVAVIEDEINNALAGTDVFDQKKIDETLIALDGTADRSRLGGNAMIGVSIAVAKAAARAAGKEVYEYLPTLAEIKPSRPLNKGPLLYMNLCNGGKHAKTPLAFQEYHIIPQFDDVREALSVATAVQAALRDKLITALGPSSANFGDEGGFVPNTADVRLPLELLAASLKELNLTDKVKLSLDVAASSFYENGIYAIGDEKLASDVMLQKYLALAKEFSLFSIEDPFAEEDFADFAVLKTQGGGMRVVGDDLTTTNAARLQKAIDGKSVDALIIKPNQVGTLSETLATMRLARENNIECIVSHRSGETNDDFIADLAWAFGCFGLKAGAPTRGERVAKYNRLWEIQKSSPPRSGV
jgi:enolase